MGGVNGGGGRTRRAIARTKDGSVVSPNKDITLHRTTGKVSNSLRGTVAAQRPPRIVPASVHEERAKQHEEHAKRYHTQARSAARQDQRMRKKGDTVAAAAAKDKKAALEFASKYHANEAKRQRRLANAI
jgi:ribosomal protein S17